MDFNDKVEFTPEGFEKAIKALDFLPEDKAKQIASVFCIIAKML